MSEWIDRVSAEFENQQQARLHFASVFPPKANRAWQSLAQILARDIEEINAKHRNTLGSLSLDTSKSDVIQISKTEYPSYWVKLTLMIDGRQIALENRVVSDLNKMENFHAAYLDLDLDRNDNLRITDPHRASPDLDRLSEWLLTPIILSSAPYPHGR